MRAFTLGLALFGLPVVTAADPPSALPSRESPTQSAERSTGRQTVPLVFKSGPAQAAATPRSVHRDHEGGAVILELRMDEHGVARKGPVHCHGHVFRATFGAPPVAEK